ncbi:Apc15p protein-domain-containing protein [Microdochium trichocladiopsis]|uniref:Apc15p protein-domain-containing protein n=1 Tax=Microdochium trichocladiopsis TaxID=1682393 RepID=A0A9P8YIG8_9PEZI|nr:Apc15p protein-domain-containing protein [Microdochium trichocladiopsis]KAH7040548.1 Apc15p protein-domain-containing protein [Microdochium trichocladiopsis]
MLSLLPDLAPRDSHSLWYTSSRNPASATAVWHDPNHNPLDPSAANNGASAGPNPRRAAHLIERSPLARLRADEQNLERRRQNVTNFGSAWLKPPGIPKTLYQLREERREAEEHQEAMRREQLAQELAEAEAAGGGGADVDGPENGEQVGEEGADGMDDVQLDGARDLDEDIPEGDSAGFGLNSDDEDDDEEEDEDEENEDGDEGGASMANRAAEAQLMAQRMREASSFQGDQGASFYDGDEDLDDEARAGMIEEDDLIGDGDMDDMGMGADLDDDIPEGMSGGLSGGYEHTDTDLSSSDDGEDQGNTSFPPARAPQTARFRTSLARSDATRHSLAISDLLSRDGSSVLGSSPQMPRQPGYGR